MGIVIATRKADSPSAFPICYCGHTEGQGEKMKRNTYFAQIFEQKIKAWCKTNKATQQDFCNRVGVHPNMITRYKQGKAYPTKEVLEIMCSVLGCNANEFIPVAKKEKTLSDYTTQELLAEIERRCGK